MKTKKKLMLWNIISIINGLWLFAFNTYIMVLWLRLDNSFLSWHPLVMILGSTITLFLYYFIGIILARDKED